MARDDQAEMFSLNVYQLRLEYVSAWLRNNAVCETMTVGVNPTIF